MQDKKLFWFIEGGLIWVYYYVSFLLLKVCITTLYGVLNAQLKSISATFEQTRLAKQPNFEIETPLEISFEVIKW